MSQSPCHVPPVALSIAGSDSGAGAGIQADLKVFAALGLHGTSAITCITAQSPSAVDAIAPVDCAIIEQQISTVCQAFPVAAAKTGMLYSKEIVLAVAQTLKLQTIPFLVVDPVMISTSGTRLLLPDAVQALIETIIPMATVITPNLAEAEHLGQCRITTVDDMQSTAGAIARRFNTTCIIKGGHLPESTPDVADIVPDVIHDGNDLTILHGSRVPGPTAHGTGCAFSAALAANLALGKPIAKAAQAAKDFVHVALQTAWTIGTHRVLTFSATSLTMDNPNPVDDALCPAASPAR